MFNRPLLDVGRTERVANAIAESIKQLKLSIEKCSTQLNAAMLRQQTLANVEIVLALYKFEDSQGRSVPTIIISGNKKQVYASVVHTRYHGNSPRHEMVDFYRGPKLRFRLQGS